MAPLPEALSGGRAPGPRLRPVTKKTVTEDAVSQIASLILEGQLRPGDRLPSDRDLSEQLGIGTTSVREALRSLRLMGLVQMRSGRGAVVRGGGEALVQGPLKLDLRLGDGYVRHLNEARKMLEAGLAGLAAERRRGEHLASLQEAIARMEEALERSGDFADADVAFHALVAEAADNPIIACLVGTIRDVLRTLVEQTLRLPGSTERALAEHRRIAQAISARDVAAARLAMEEHVEYWGRELLALVAAVKAVGKGAGQGRREEARAAVREIAPA